MHAITLSPAFTPDALLKPAEAAAHLRTTVRTLANWRALHRGPRYVKLIRSVRYRRSDLDAFMRTVGDADKAA